MTDTTTSTPRPTVQTDVSPYHLAKVAGVPGPMVYTYIKKGYIRAELTETGKKVIRCGEANRWLRVYWEKNRAK
jgi:predicted site-specific integrase-resolvase